MLQKTVYEIIRDNNTDRSIRWLTTSETQEWRTGRNGTFCVISRPSISPTGNYLCNGKSEKNVTLDIYLNYRDYSSVSNKDRWIKNKSVEIKNLLNENKQNIYDKLFNHLVISIHYNPTDEEKNIRNSSSTITLECTTWADIEEEI